VESITVTATQVNDIKWSCW